MLILTHIEKEYPMSLINEALAKKTWAVVGATDNKEKFGYKIYKFMKDAGYDVYAVNPGVKEIMGETCFPSLEALPVTPEAVDVVVPPRVGEQVLQQCVQLGINIVWLQPGADAASVVQSGENLGLKVIHDACVMVEIRNQRS